MEEILIKGNTLPGAYGHALTMLWEAGDIVDCSDWNTNQKEISMTIHVVKPLAEPRISKLFIGGPKELEQYRQEMLDGILDFEVERGNWEYTYHDRMVNHHMWKDLPDFGYFTHDNMNQIDFVIGELKRSPSSRRAVITVRDPAVDAFSDEPACLQHIQFFIRNGKLDCKVLFRSNDACKAAFMNAFALICLQERVAHELSVEVGTYTHRANSFHCYERDFELLEGYVDRIRNSNDIYDIAYDYEGDWREQMEEYQGEIMRQVEELKQRAR